MLTGMVVSGWALSLVLGVVVLRMGLREWRSDRVLGLLYHRVVPQSLYDTFRGTERRFSISEERLREQLDWLSANGFNIVSYPALRDFVTRGLALPAKPVFITFDDGCESVAARALPMFQERNLPATVFVTTDPGSWVFREGEYAERQMSRDQLKRCVESGFEVGSHGVSHRSLPDMEEADALAELTRSKAQLAEWTGEDPSCFSIPLNANAPRLLGWCRRAGYSVVFNSDEGTCNGTTDPFRVPRINVDGTHDLQGFQRLLRPERIVQKRLLGALKRAPMRVLGERRWMPLRAWIFATPLGARLSNEVLRKALWAFLALFVLLQAVGTWVVVQGCVG